MPIPQNLHLFFYAESIKTTHFLPKVDFVRLYLILRLGKKRIDFLLLLSTFYYLCGV